jgi:hypothetical protein
LHRALGGELVRAGEIEPPLEPDRVVGEVLEQHRPALGDGVVTEPPLLRREGSVGVGEMLGVAGLVEEGAPVVGTALRLHHEHHAARHLDRRAERPRILARAVLEVELDVLLRPEVDPEIGECPLERRQHPVGREGRVPFDAAPGPAHVPALDLAEPDPDTRAEEPVACLHPEVLRVGKEAPALLREVVEGQAEAPVEVGVAVGAQPAGLALDDLRRLQLERDQVFLGERESRRVDPLAYGAALLVHQPRPEHPERDLLAVDRCGQSRLELCDALLLLADEVAEVAGARELPQLAPAAVAVDRRPERECRVESRQALVALVDRRDVVGLLVAGEVEVRLFVDLGEEALGLRAQGVDLLLFERLGHAGS